VGEVIVLARKKKKPLSRSEIMSHIKGKDTKIEVLLRKELWHRGLRYRKNYTGVVGKPDIVFLRKKIAVFCDSEFWHGKMLMEGKAPKTNRDYWLPKLQRNIERDKEVTSELLSMGWTVLRFWEADIQKDVTVCADTIEKFFKEKQ